MKTETQHLTDIPFSPRKFPFFYGWVIVAATTIGMVATIPGQTVGISVFTDSLVAAFSLTRTQLSLAYMFGTITSSFILPFAGSYIDRLGSRIFVVISSVGLGAGLVLLSNAAFISNFLQNTISVIFAASVLFLIVRFFGQGCLTMVSRITIGKWFNHRRGLASGISSIIIAFIFNGSPAFLNTIVLSLGWRQTYWLLALAIGCGMAAIGWLFFRDNPEQCGLVMDGTSNISKDNKKLTNLPETVKDFTRSEALKTREFWTIAFVTGWQSFIMTAVAFHMTSIGREFSLNSEQSFYFFRAIAVASAFVVFMGGWISDYIRLKWILIATIIGQVCLAFGLLDLASTIGKISFIAGYALSGGLFGVLVTVAWPRYFGRKHLGSITGITSSILVFASSIAPIAFSTLLDLTGSHRAATIVSVIIPALFIIPALAVHNPQRKLANQ